MKNYTTNKIRNIGIIGHGSEGKTTLTEAMLFNAKAIDRFGRVEDGTTTTDYDPEEIKRHISISAATAPLEWNQHKLNVIDVPGYFDFVGEMAGALRVVDSACIVVGAVSGVIVGTEKAWDYCKEYGIPRIIFINQMDRENANFKKVIDQLKELYGTSIAPFQVPIMEGGQFTGFVDVIAMKAMQFKGKDMVEISIPDSMKDEVEPIRTILVEAAAETSEELMEKYFSGEDLTEEEIRTAVREGVVCGDVVPVICGSAVNNQGVTTLMDTIVNYLPAPGECGGITGEHPQTGEPVERTYSSSEPFSALVFKTVVDPFVGKLSIFKVMSGELTTGINVYNPNKEKVEKINNIYLLRGKKQESVDKVVTGDIAAVAKLQVTMTGDTLCDQSGPVLYEGIRFPEPSISLAVVAEKEGEEEKVFSGLYRLTEEDPTFTVDKNQETGEMLISGVGEMHLEIISKRLQNKFGVGVAFKEPKIPYRETIRKSIKAEGRHKKQSGGHGQFGHVWIEFEPLPDTEQEFEFVDKIVGGVVPKQYIPAVDKGLRECLSKGVLAGYPMVGIKATLYDGSYHSVDSSEMAFKVAASLAYRKLDQANPVLLEPIMRAEVIVPDDYMGDIIGDLNKRRGRILGMNPLGNGMQEVVAEVPQAEMAKYATDLRSMTQARGSFKLTFVRYEEVPANISAKVVEQAKQENAE
ncbi:MAG: elongation factor G [Caldicoprobacterales bacterium]|nr:elongation factor G [Clostridiales bacterium]